MKPLLALVSALLRFLRRVLLLAAGAVLLLFTLTLGLVLGLVFLVWAKLTGRSITRPRVFTMGRWPGMPGSPGTPGGGARGDDVVDIEAREVPPRAPQRIDHQP
jgi:hypothetical protein